ncbi:putative helicase mov-10-B.2 isoform X4 [Zootermopsis nevadensis]|uniref:putative helicase mov-10-B.2 isoform X3 n=1 Tax=Zootermopsis nevadensis TaxID=136037 RepID=UPI000B8E4490|nr:putative helicase mov-10-B.2 isoform X3 [Zootermopsis nevadensis]XP_021920404.1 putative helicase mov-10-B.2 isoform X4 [Zootermopsis nevadensis]XP_021920405.1 putative helicase mov-10-B.2 isoform X3 [Zootermopsis nevadensis]XP_021920406.1 putative helicase mov-10-B.2 isoform X4 [Zootermopsis nevadensis]
MVPSNMTKARGKKLQQKKNKSRGAVGPTFCHLCGIEAEDSVAFQTIHLEERRHKYNYLLALFKERRKTKAKDRHGVKVDVFSRGNKVPSSADGTVKSIIDTETSKLDYEFEVMYTGVMKNRYITLIRVMLLHPYKAFRAEDDLDISTGAEVKIRLHKGASYMVKVTFQNCGIGTYGVPVCFTFERETSSSMKVFDIIKTMVVNVTLSGHSIGNAESHKESPFTGEPWLGGNVTIPGNLRNGKRITRLLKYSIPDELKILFGQNLLPWDGIDLHMTKQLLALLTLFDDNLGKDNYANYFHSLLYLDEYETLYSLERYNMSNVSLEIVSDKCLKLEVPGLAERRPSVLKRDLIYIKEFVGRDEWACTQYECLVADVTDTYIRICDFDSKLMESLESNPDLRFSVRFTLNRFPFYVMHQAIDQLVDKGMFHAVFPTDLNFPVLRIKGHIEFINPLIETNPEQQKAVENILLGTSRPAPYIIFGPPGTGKTVTVVEAILQVKKKIRESYILVCAPSNAACDLLAQKLIAHCTTEELLRLHSSSRDWTAVPEDLHPYSNRSEGTYSFPDEKQIQSYRIIVCTLINSEKLQHKVNGADFTHVFIDECGQALEPGALVPLAGILGKASRDQAGGQVILAGDPLQLGPVCHSKKAEGFGLGLSLLERLMMKCELYMKNTEEGSYNNRFITKLRRNFRSHELILELPNTLFYDGELIPACGVDVTNDRVKNLENDPRFNLAVVFHGVLGHEKKEGRSPSFFNEYELDAVVCYVGKLLEGGPSREPVEQKDIGIIAPYIRQVYKLKYRLKQKGWENVEVGTTEIFQGREKRVILISTVRSNRNLLAHDSKFGLGFVANAKRFNVAVTRACSLLIIVGNPHLLENDANWRNLIYLTQKLKSYRGCKYSPRRDDAWMEQVINRFEKLSAD